jgi:Kef-type K+ transport system membrane component KefB/Trk K+ transport system NAD-binding subunit
MHASIFSELSLIIALAAAVSMIMRLLRQPLIIGHIITGIIVGPAMLKLANSPQTIDVFSNIGIALLLFIIGLGLNPRVIKEVGKVAATAGLLQVFLSTALGWGCGHLLGFNNTESLFLGVALAFSSTIIILKLLSDKKEQSRLYGKIATGMLLIQDVLAAFALLFVTAQAKEGGFSPLQLGALIGKGLVIAVPLLFIGNVVLPKLHRFIASSQELLFLFAVGWGFGFAALFELTGFSLEIGALLAGVALASLPYTQEISARLRPLRDFFIVVFFIALGTRLTFVNFGLLLPAILLGSFIVIVLKPLVVLVIMGLMGYTKRTSFKAAIAMAQVSEFSLIFVVLANKSGLVSSDLVSVLTFVTLISIAVSAYMILYADKLFVLFEHDLTMFERRKHHFERESRHRFDLVLFGYQKGGHEFVKVFKSLKKPFVVIDYDPEVIDLLEHQQTNYVYGDAADIELLEEVGLDKAKLIVSTVSDHETNIFLTKLLSEINPHAVIILHAETVEEAAELYELGASYVVIPHYIGSEKIGAFIRKSGLKKSEFKKYREKHLAYLQTHYEVELDPEAETEAA